MVPDAKATTGDPATVIEAWTVAASDHRSAPGASDLLNLINLEYTLDGREFAHGARHAREAVDLGKEARKG